MVKRQGGPFACYGINAVMSNNWHPNYSWWDKSIPSRLLSACCGRYSILSLVTPLTSCKYSINGEDVTSKIRTPEVTKIVSEVSSIKEVRFEMVEVQRKLAEGKDVIMEGRDICTYVFPNADVKIYLDASIDERARRRYKEMKEKGIDITFEEVRDNIEKRDLNDMSKEVGALKKAEDSIVVDSTSKTIDEVVEEIIEIIKEKRKNF